MKPKQTDMFAKEERSTFPYWFAHWCAFQMTALRLRAWKPRHLLHDWEKPWLRLLLPYARVQAIHRRRSRHHLERGGDIRWEDMVIDWECSRLTKEASPRTAVEEAGAKLAAGEMTPRQHGLFIEAARGLGLAAPEAAMDAGRIQEAIGSFFKSRRPEEIEDFFREFDAAGADDAALEDCAAAWRNLHNTEIMDDGLRAKAEAFAKRTTHVKCGRIGRCAACPIRHCDYKSRVDAFLKGAEAARAGG